MTQPRYPSIAVRFTIEGTTRHVAALIDTGFDGYLVVPLALVADLPPPSYADRVETASGQVVRAAAFLAAIEFADLPGAFDGRVIALGSEFLVGLMSINRIRLILDHGHRVIAER